MSVNPYRPHLLIVPEDDALHLIATGFRLRVPFARIRVADIAGDRDALYEQFVNKELTDLKKFPSRVLVLLTDFDNGGGRHDDIRSATPKDLRERVFVLGPKKEAEDLRQEMLAAHLITPNKFETIGEVMAAGCTDQELPYPALQQLDGLSSELARASARLQEIFAEGL